MYKYNFFVKETERIINIIHMYTLQYYTELINYV